MFRPGTDCRVTVSLPGPAHAVGLCTEDLGSEALRPRRLKDSPLGQPSQTDRNICASRALLTRTLGARTRLLTGAGRPRPWPAAQAGRGADLHPGRLHAAP